MRRYAFALAVVACLTGVASAAEFRLGGATYYGYLHVSDTGRDFLAPQSRVYVFRSPILYGTGEVAARPEGAQAQLVDESRDDDANFVGTLTEQQFHALLTDTLTIGEAPVAVADRGELLATEYRFTWRRCRSADEANDAAGEICSRTIALNQSVADSIAAGDTTRTTAAIVSRLKVAAVLLLQKKQTDQAAPRLITRDRYRRIAGEPQ